jgi:hypothetical protein
MYFLSIEDGDWLGPAEDSLSAVSALLPPGSPESVVAEAYRGALEVVRAKHARWPPNKLGHLKRGGEILDALVTGHPDHLEVRYLRLASYVFLPFFLKREEEVRVDMETLAAGLSNGRSEFTPWMYPAVVKFVLDNGELDEATRSQLTRSVEGTD